MRLTPNREMRLSSVGSWRASGRLPHPISLILTLYRVSPIILDEHNLSGYTQSDLDKVALRLNQRPRKTLGFQTPASKLQQSVASTGRAGTTYQALATYRRQN